MDRDEFMELVYETFADEPDNVLANGIIEAADAYVEHEKAQLSQEGTTSDMISKFIDGLEEIFADLRERHVDDSVCGLCEYDGAYMGQSGDWCNECPGFDRDDCFKLSDETRKKWTEEIVKALPTVQPEPQWIPVERGFPEDYTDVLVWFEYFRYGDYNCLYQTHGIGTYVANYNSWIVNHESGWKDLRVIAWMPLPEAYKPNK